jgi:hypothetical protein
MFIAVLFFLDRRLAFAATIFAVLLGGPSDAIGSDHGGHAPVEEEIVESATGFRGVDLGEFTIRSFRPTPARRDEVNFRLHATVKSEQFHEFDALYQRRTSKVRDQVIVATRLVPVEAYDDAELKTLRRRILLRLRRTLPELKIDDVYVSDFNLMVDGL